MESIRYGHNDKARLISRRPEDPTILNDAAYDCINQACIPIFDEPSQAFGAIAQYTNDCRTADPPGNIRSMFIAYLFPVNPP